MHFYHHRLRRVVETRPCPRIKRALACIDKDSKGALEEMDKIKSRYTLAEAAEYLRREAGTPDVSIHDIVTPAAEGTLTVCFPYKGPLGLFKNGHADTPTEAEITQSIFGQALKTFYFNGILRSLSRPAPDNEFTDLRGKTRKAHTLHPVRVVPVSVFGSAPTVELGEPEGHHWRRVHESRHLLAGTLLTADIPDAVWMIEAESLHALAAPLLSAYAATGSPAIQRQREGHAPYEPPQEETPEQRQDRRLARLHELGGSMKQVGTSWRTQGTRGLLAQLLKEEKAAGRPMSDKSDVRQDLIAATKRMREGNTRAMMGEQSPKHSHTALENAWGNLRGS